MNGGDFLYITANSIVCVDEIKAVKRKMLQGGVPGDCLFVYYGPGNNDVLILEKDKFNDVFGTNYSEKHINDHLLELFIKEAGIETKNRPSTKAISVKNLTEPRNCPVCGSEIPMEMGTGISNCPKCGVILNLGN